MRFLLEDWLDRHLAKLTEVYYNQHGDLDITAESVIEHLKAHKPELLSLCKRKEELSRYEVLKALKIYGRVRATELLLEVGFPPPRYGTGQRSRRMYFNSELITQFLKELTKRNK